MSVLSHRLVLLAVAIGLSTGTAALAQAGLQAQAAQESGKPPAGTEANLATQLSNPVSSLISVPFQLNYNQGMGTGDGTQTLLNIQPVIPISISENWNLISRTILPLVSLSDMTPDFGTRNGLGNTTQSFFFSPKAPTKGGLIWGVGPVFQVPTATNGIAPNQWGAGITGVALTQKKGWTVGILANQIWSVNKEDQFGESSNMFLQPFVSYSTKKATSITLNTESTYNWIDETWSVPINFTVGQIVKLGGKPVQITVGVRYWAENPEGGAEDWGARLVVTYLFPKGRS